MKRSALVLITALGSGILMSGAAHADYRQCAYTTTGNGAISYTKTPDGQDPVTFSGVLFKNQVSNTCLPVESRHIYGQFVKTNTLPMNGIQIAWKPDANGTFQDFRQFTINGGKVWLNASDLDLQHDPTPA